MCYFLFFYIFNVTFTQIIPSIPILVKTRNLNWLFSVSFIQCFLSHLKYKFCHFQIFLFPTINSEWHLKYGGYWYLHKKRHLFWGYFLFSDIHYNRQLSLPVVFGLKHITSLAAEISFVHWPTFVYLLTETLFQALSQLTTALY